MNKEKKEIEEEDILGDITQRLLEIAEQKRPIEEWNENMSSLYYFIHSYANKKLEEVRYEIAVRNIKNPL